MWTHGVLIRRQKRYIFIIVDDNSIFTWTMFLSSKDETFKVFTISSKLVQKKLKLEIISIQSDHGIEFENK